MKRFVAILLTAAMLMQAGCSTGKTQQPNTTSEQTTTTEQNTETQTEASTETQTEATNETAAGEKLVLTVMASEHPNQPFRSDSEVFKWIEERTNVTVKLEAFPGADWQAKATTLMATDNMPDMMLKVPDYAKFAREGLFLKLSDYFDVMPNFKKIYDETPAINALLVDGDLYAFPTMARYLNRMGLVPMIREDLVKAYGLSTPTSFEELLNVLKVFKEKNPDTNPWVIRNNNIINNIAFPMGSGFGMYFDGDIDGGTFLYGQATEEFKDVLTFVNKLYAEGLLDPDYATVNPQQWSEKMSTGNGLFYFDNPSFAINFDKSLKQLDASFTLAPMPTLKNYKGQQRNYFYPKHWLEADVVSSNVKNPEAVAKFVDWMYSEEGADLLNFGVEGVTYTKNGDEYQINQEIVDNHKANDTDPWRGFMGQYGLGLLGFCSYMDERNQWQFMDPTVKTWYDLWIADTSMREPVVMPILSEADQVTYADIITKCNTIYDSEVHNFITGAKPISEWDNVVAQFKAQGIDDAIKMVNDAYKK